MRKSKAIVSIITACLIFAGIFSSTAFASGELAGDVNLDKKVDVEDALLVLRATTGTTELTAAQQAVADVTYDGTVNSVDALRILLFVTGSVGSLDKVGGDDGDDIVL